MSKERLTYKTKDGSYNSKKSYYVLANKLAEYEDLEEQGLILRLPCKVGDTGYAIFITGVNSERHVPIYEIFEVKIIKFIQDAFALCVEIMTKNKQKSAVTVSAFGNSLFLTQSAAEEKLRELEGYQKYYGKFSQNVVEEKE